MSAAQKSAITRKIRQFNAVIEKAQGDRGLWSSDLSQDDIARNSNFVNNMRNEVAMLARRYAELEAKK